MAGTEAIENRVSGFDHAGPVPVIYKYTKKMQMGERFLFCLCRIVFAVFRWLDKQKEDFC